MSPRALLKAVVWYVRKEKQYWTFICIDKIWYYFCNTDARDVGKLSSMYRFMIEHLGFPVVLIYQPVNDKVPLSIDSSTQNIVVKFYQQSLDQSEWDESGIDQASRDAGTGSK